MICEHCGGTVVQSGQACAQCGMTASRKPSPKSVGKVVPFRPRKRAHKRQPKIRRFSSTTWWILAIVIVSLLLPYLTPFAH